MFQVKFSKVVKYKGVKYPAHTPFEVDDSDIDSITADGATILEVPKAITLGSAQNEGDEILRKADVDETPEPEVDPLAGMTVAELASYAEERGINIKGISKKADIIDFINKSIVD